MSLLSLFHSTNGIMKAGSNVVRLISYLICTSFDEIAYDKEKGLVITKEDSKRDPEKWNTPTQQVAILVAGESGAITHRMSVNSWLLADRPDHYTQAMRESGQYVVVGKYVCEVRNGKLERIPNSSGELRCRRIIESFLFAITGGKAGIDGDQAMDQAIALKTDFIVNVENEVYEGVLQSRLDPDGFKPYHKTVDPEPVEEMDADLKA